MLHWNVIKGNFLGAKVQVRLEPRSLPQLRQPVVYRSKVVESLWQRSYLSQISYSLAVWAVFFLVYFSEGIVFADHVENMLLFLF